MTDLFVSLTIIAAILVAVYYLIWNSDHYE